MKWRVLKVCELCLPTEQWDPRLSPDEPFIYIDISTIDKDSKTIMGPATILGADAPSRARKKVCTDDVLVSTVRPNLNAVAMVPSEFDGQIASTGFCVLRPRRDMIAPRYLFYRTMTPEFVAHLVSQMRGANYPAVTDSGVKGVLIPLPPLSEQRRIVEILDQADALRKRRAEADAKAKRILPALFYKMFGDPLTNNKRWNLDELGTLCHKITSGSRDWAKYVGRRGSLFVRSQNIKDGEVTDDLSPIDPPGGAEAERTRLRDGDVVIAITGDVGKAAVFKSKGKAAYVNQHTALVRVGPNLHPEFLVALANYSDDHPILSASQYGQTRPGLGFRELKTARIIVPPRDLQKAFAKQFREVQRLKRTQRKANDVFGSLSAALLHQAFSGDLTAKWREAHMKELLAEMEEQAKVLST